MSLAAVVLLSLSGCYEKVPLKVTNGLEMYDIHCIYISRNSDDVWGTNHLPGTDILGPGRTAEILVLPGRYDIQAMDQDGDTYTLNDVQVPSDGFEWTVTIDQIDANTTTQAAASAGNCSIIITNDLGGWNIEGIWISSSESSSWGENYLQGEILYQGDSFTAFVQPDTYDIYLIDNDDDTYTRWGVTVTESGYDWKVTLSDLDGGGSSGGG
ncbi:hypothetical protein CSA37_02980 [Candidatus Fermentibacteria bacterium]|nr:MAG: hypothetical protein CSA37_02980 [Candidatus Fermentibacteria bacterium]